ncbi:MAG: cache and HAMP domain-containing protein, partial [Candidatus Marinimicrobia bacterium]|nr:cache and HAMP domain-containing protein [Candidatus Neomarinimicrobiota bacterium]
MRLPFQFKKIRTRLAVWFVVIATVPLLIGTFITYQQRVNTIKVNKYEKLTAIRDLKVSQLNNWLDERTGDIKTIAGDQEIINYTMAVIHQDKVYEEQQLTIISQELLRRYVDNYNSYHELFIINAETGHIILSNNPASIGVDKSKNSYFTGPLQTNELFIKEIYRSESNAGQPEMTFSIPIICTTHQPNVVGVLVARIDLQNSLYKLLLDRTGLGQTGETLIVNKNLIALNDLRHYDDAPLNLHITAEPAVNAAAGMAGIIEINDYRDEPVLAAYTHIPRTGWGFVAKQDQQEIYAPISVMLVDLSILMLISILGIYGISFFLARITSQPILEMVNVSSKIGAGDFSARNAITTIDETATLARSINEFARSIETQIFVTGGLGDISKLFITSKKLKELGNKLIQQLTDLSQSQLGAIYLFNKESGLFEPFESIGFQADKLVSFDASSLEGEFGRALSTREIVHLTDIPADTSFLFKTVMGSAIPKEIINIP